MLHTLFEGKKLKSITSGDVNLDWVQGDDNKEEKDTTDEGFSAFLSRIKETLKDKVKDVRISHRLTTFPACFVNDSLGSFYPHFLKNEDDSFRGRPILEVNAKHPYQDLDHLLDDYVGAVAFTHTFEMFFQVDLVTHKVFTKQRS